MVSAKELLDSFEKVDREKVSEAAVIELGNVKKIKRFSFIDEDDRDYLFNLLVARRVFFPQSKMVCNIVDDFLELSLSIKGKGSQNIVDLFKTEIQQITQNTTQQK